MNALRILAALALLAATACDPAVGRIALREFARRPDPFPSRFVPDPS